MLCGSLLGSTVSLNLILGQDHKRDIEKTMVGGRKGIAEGCVVSGSLNLHKVSARHRHPCCHTAHVSILL